MVQALQTYATPTAVCLWACSGANVAFPKLFVEDLLTAMGQIRLEFAEINCMPCFQGVDDGQRLRNRVASCT